MSFITQFIKKCSNRSLLTLFVGCYRVWAVTTRCNNPRTVLASLTNHRKSLKSVITDKFPMRKFFLLQNRINWITFLDELKRNLVNTSRFMPFNFSTASSISIIGGAHRKRPSCKAYSTYHRKISYTEGRKKCTHFNVQLKQFFRITSDLNIDYLRTFSKLNR
jgi:hypothetical protein